MRNVCAAILVLTLFAGDALAADGALPPGQSAGVAQAQNSINPIWPVTIGTLLLGVGAWAISTQHDTISSEIFGSNDNGLVTPINSSTSTTTSTH